MKNARAIFRKKAFQKIHQGEKNQTRKRGVGKACYTRANKIGNLRAKLYLIFLIQCHKIETRALKVNSQF